VQKGREKTGSTERKVKHNMKESIYKSYDELPLFLNAETVAKVLGVSPSSGYELMHEPDFPVLKVGSRLVVPKEKFVEWVSRHTQGGAG
jgi:predicted DNA-binding transcriptional regulator AlpA